MQWTYLDWQWMLVIGSSLFLLWIAPKARSIQAFYQGSRNERAPSVWLLTSSLVISWLFAKSITNAANLGLTFGFVGSVAYAAYYLSFAVAGVIIYRIRTKGGFSNIHAFLRQRYGQGAIVIFSVLIAFRLFNEVWSNTMVIGSYFGESGSFNYYLAILVFTGLTLAYSLKGGMSSAILTDLIQMLFFGLILVVLLTVLIPKAPGGARSFVESGTWSWGTGVNLLVVALLQSFSYPFHDPVMTDRGFISDTRTTLSSFLMAAVIGAICILLFSFIGIYGSWHGVEGQAAVGVARLLGLPMLLLVNFIMITSAASTLDSTFSSFAKLVQLDLRKGRTPSIKAGQWSMALITLLGTIPVFLDPAILSATTVSGTMVLGLGPVFLFWYLKAPPLSFHLSVGIGILIGLLLATGLYPTAWHLTDGKYADLLSANVLGVGLSLLGFFLPYWLISKPKLYDLYS